MKHYAKALKIIKKSQLFDGEWYLSANPDVRAAGIDPAQHYLLHGAVENRDPSNLFSTIKYKREFPEIQISGENPLVHYARRNGDLDPIFMRTKRLPIARSQPTEFIPKIFHSVWLSGEHIPSPLRLGAESFAKLHPEFQIKKWTLKDLEGDDTTFLREALDRRKWAFATDYVRLKALFEYGGVYSDGDVAFYAKVDNYLQFDSVLCWENYFAIGPHFIMSKPRNQLIGRILDIYKTRSIYCGDNLNLTPMPVIVTWLLTTEFGLRLDGSPQILLENNLVEAENVFTTNFGDRNCIAEHLYYGGWVNEQCGSYKDALLDTAKAWAAKNRTKSARLRRKLSTRSMQWAYYFLTNAQTAFPAIEELPQLEHFRSLKKRFLGGCLTPRRTVLKAVKPADPLVAVSKWHVKPKMDVAASTTNTDGGEGQIKNLPFMLKRKNHKVDVVVPIYNVDKYLVRCLKSLQHQSYENFEVLLIDDGSTDGSAAIAREMCSADARFRYFHKPNGGLGDARNYAIPYLNSDLVTFIDSDDFIDVDHLESLVAKFQQGHDLAICNFKVAKPDGRIIECRELSKFWGEEDPIIHALVSNYECYAWNKMYMTKTFTDNEHARYSLGWFEDMALTPALIACSQNLGFVDAKSYNYVQRSGSILSTSHKNIDRNIEIFDSFKMLMKHKDRIPLRYWSVYANWMAPKHYFYWRIIAILGEKSYGARVATASAFSEALNATVPDWFESPFIEKFVREPVPLHERLSREKLVNAFRYNDLAFYASTRDLADFGL